MPDTKRIYINEEVCIGCELCRVSFMSSIPFTPRGERIDEAASASGQMREHSSEEFPKIEEIIREQAKTVEAVLIK